MSSLAVRAGLFLHVFPRKDGRAPLGKLLSTSSWSGAPVYSTRPAQMKSGCGLHNGSVGAGCASTLAVVVIVQVVLECVSDVNHL